MQTHTLVNDYILCADDDLDDQSFLTNSFYEVAPHKKLVIVSNGNELMAFLKGLSPNEELPSLIILDQRMPLLDGQETLQSLKADPHYSKIPVVILSTTARMINVAIVETCNTDYEIKPYDITGWKKIAEKMIGRCNTAIK